jgi:queuine tRNA-ribosyltransferase
MHTPHGHVETPAFVAVGTKATVKALSVEQVREAGLQIVLGNTYHLFLEPGEEIVREAGGLGAFMNWSGPTMTDSGGFQVFSLGAAFGEHVSKLAEAPEERGQGLAVYDEHIKGQHGKLAAVDEEGVTFTSHVDGSMHRFTPERSIEIQHKLGADIIFAFDECTSPLASMKYQEEALDRTHRWAKRSLAHHREQQKEAGLPAEAPTALRQALYGIVQGGRHEELRRKSARMVGNMEFDGFGIGGSYVKEDLDTAVGWVCEELPPERPRHLLGIGEPEDLVRGVGKGVDLFDCVAPTRLGRNGTIYTHRGKIHLRNQQYTRDFGKPDEACACYTCTHYTRAYLSHLFRSREMLAATLASLHNLFFITRLVNDLRGAILDGNYESFAEAFLKTYRT